MFFFSVKQLYIIASFRLLNNKVFNVSTPLVQMIPSTKVHRFGLIFICCEFYGMIISSHNKDIKKGNVKIMFISYATQIFKEFKEDKTALSRSL